MMSMPFEIISKIYSYLPILTNERRILNEQIKKYYYKKKWLNTYLNIEEYSLDEDNDDYYANWLENDIIYALNNENSLMNGLTVNLKYILRRIHGYNVYTIQDYDSLNIGDPISSINMFFNILNINEVEILDLRLQKYINTNFKV
tara:strand:+ start:339 stop:773 length:435 start_codon:yes stop_codon:yes gene_type:complete